MINLIPYNEFCLLFTNIFGVTTLKTSADIFVTVSCIEYSQEQILNYKNQYLMLGKGTTNKLTSLQPTPLFFQEGQSSLLSQELAPFVRTPRCTTFKKEELSSSSQKQAGLLNAKTHKVSIPALERIRTDLKQNLLDLDLCFQMEGSELCKNYGVHERQSFVIRKLRTPSVSSKGRRTAACSEESSLDNKNENDGTKNATDFSQKMSKQERGKSQSKHIMTCKVVNSKKLPFDFHSKRQKKQKVRLQDQNLQISAILQKQSQQKMLSMESFDDLCKYF